MDDDVAQMFHAVNERFKKLDAGLKTEANEREGIDGRLETAEGEITALNKAMGGWTRGNVGDKFSDIDKAIEDLKKRLDAIEKKMKK